MRRIGIVLLALAACGGGSKEGPGATSGDPPAPAGDYYYVYARTQTPTLPLGSPVVNGIAIRSHGLAGSDGTHLRIDTSEIGDREARRYDERGGLLESSGIEDCTYSPAWLNSPPPPLAAGSYTAASTATCTYGGTRTIRYSLSGTGSGVESVTTPAGTFTAFKYTQTVAKDFGTATYTVAETCWTDTRTGRTVRCQATYSTVPTGQTAPTATGSTLLDLVAYAYKGEMPVGPVVRRFTGLWTVAFAGTVTGRCRTLIVTEAGRVSGSCEMLVSPGVYGTSFFVTGNVGASGVVGLTASTGATLTGLLSTPYSGSGTWSAAPDGGTWTAEHL